MAVYACVIIICSFNAILYKTTAWNDDILRILENVKYDGQFFEISFSKFDAVVHILFKISLAVTDKLNEGKFLRDSWFEYKVVF